MFTNVTLVIVAQYGNDNKAYQITPPELNDNKTFLFARASLE